MLRELDALLPARTHVARLAAMATDAASRSAAGLCGSDALELDAQRVAAAYASDRHLRIDGEPVSAFAPLSAFFEASDGAVRTHANYPWHREALLRSLGLSAHAQHDDVVRAIRDQEAAAFVDRLRAFDGVGAQVASAPPPELVALAREPVVTASRTPSGAAPVRGDVDAPLRGVRVLDLTRVIAGPVATRTLAFFGADVLRVDPPQHREVAWQHLDTGAGKRSIVLDVGDPRFARLVADADVVVSGYRPGALASRGFDARAWQRLAPGRVLAELSAWGPGGGRGFDSIVQAATGISMIESTGGGRPGALPVQALDHSAGYLIAAAIMDALRTRDLGGMRLETSLVRVAAELLSFDVRTTPAHAVEQRPSMQQVDVDGTRVQLVRPAVGVVGGRTAFRPPTRWGSDAPAWLPRD